ncbi:hypothetical protein LUZ60_017654 [Juncus effusus]|nr:hypothetical protein LUZ60_017654 [Juncus effusus]
MCLDIPWEENDIWSTFVGYLFILHVPLSFGGLSIISSFLRKPTLDPLSIVISTAILQAIELGATLSLLQYTTKPTHDFYDFVFGKIILPKRNWVIKTAIGIVFLISLMFLTSILLDKFIEPKDVNDPIIKEILSHGPVAQLLFFYLYCINAPILEEIVYRGFLLSSLGSKPNIKTWEAIVLSSFMFSLAHFSFENSLQLFSIGCILGFMYCWSGTLASPIIVHSIYNAIILVNEILTIS